MVKGRSKGADWLAREKGLIRPGFTSTSAAMFAQRGNPWLTQAERDREFPLNRSVPADTPDTELQQQARAIRHRAEIAITGKATDYSPPKPSVHIDPEMDFFTKAERPAVRQKYVDPKGTPVIRDQARWRANLLRKTRLAIANTVIDCKDNRDGRRPEKIKGNFYDFSSAPMTDEKRKRLRSKR